jgi:predicted ATP-binding protein involved in virulence
MTETFITQIQINQSRNIHNFSIPLSEEERKHLIITGKNGSGKTSLLYDLVSFLRNIEGNRYKHYDAQINQLKLLNERKSYVLSFPLEQQQPELQTLEQNIKSTKEWFVRFGGTEIYFANPYNITEKVNAGEYLIAFFDIQRQTNLNIPSGINKIDIKKKYQINDNVNQYFIQYIVNLKADRSFAKDDGEMDVVEKIDNWFQHFEKNLKEIFDSQDLQLKFDRKNYNFDIIQNDKLPFSFNTLSSGYSAIISIVTELILRMEAHESKSYNLEGIVLIDEIETHLHVDLQKKILPFLISFFPRIQFIVTTHSPFILNSIENAVICDLEKKIVTTDLSGYSWDTLIESYFDSDKYSNLLKSYVSEYERLVDMNDLNEVQKNRLFELKNYLREIPKFVADELAVKLQQIKLKERNKRHK